MPEIQELQDFYKYTANREAELEAMGVVIQSDLPRIAAEYEKLSGQPLTL